MTIVTHGFKVKVFPNGEAASEGGFDYNAWDPQPKGLKIEEMIIVQNGTVSGNATVDLVLVDADGNKYAALVTANLLKALPI